jgi:translation initiation factor IF-2
MAKIRVFQLASELGFDKNKLVTLCKENGLNIRTPLSSIDDDLASKVRALVEKSSQKSEKSDGVIRSMKDLPSISSEDLEKGRVQLSQPVKEISPKPAEAPSPTTTAPSPTLARSGLMPPRMDDGKGRKKVAMTEFERQQAKIQKRKKQKEKQSQRLQRQEQRVEREALDAQTLHLSEGVSVAELAEMMKVGAAELVSKLFSMGIMSSVNQKLDLDTCTILGEEYGFQLIQEQEEEEVIDLVDPEDDEAGLKPRIPVVTIMGHVDHGKTTLLDYVRTANVVDSEAGGITQHIGAYLVATKAGHEICFLDTPGHAAFTAMRAHGSQITDVAILVVAADDGVKPQTIEAINHARNADVPIVVAITKCDRPGVVLEKVYEELGANNLIVEAWGGSIVSQAVSGITGEGVDELLESIHLQAQLLELKANPDRHAMGVIVEAGMHKGKGAVATILVQKGTVKIGDIMVAGTATGRVRSMHNEKGEKLKFAGPSTPVEITGFSEVPQFADRFYIAANEKMARSLVEQRHARLKEQKTRASEKVVSLESLFAQVEEGKIEELKVIVKADVHGSAVALSESLERIQRDEVRVKVIHKGVGAVSEGDVMLASASGAVIICFQVRADAKTRSLADEEKVEISVYKIIYEAIEAIEKALLGRLKPVFKEKVVGRATIREVFSISKIGKIAGCFVDSGKIIRGNSARVIRDGVEVYEGRVTHLNRFKDSVTEVLSGYECGINLSYSDVKIQDVVEVFELEEIPHEL